jgi:pimeloyl-ACP methyl ester carboxylesterase
MGTNTTTTPAATGRTLAVQDATVFVREQGSGTPTLFLHGVPDTAEMWDGLIAALGPGYHSIAPDLPGLGRSTVPAGWSLRLADRARFLDNLVTALGITEPVNLVMHDFGGHYGLAWAARYPERVRRIAIFNTSFSTHYRWHANAQQFRTPILGDLLMAATSEALVRQSMRKMDAPHSDAQLHQLYADSMRKFSVRRMILRLYRETNPGDFAGWEDDLRATTQQVPAAVFWGDRDPFAPVSTADSFGHATVDHFAEYGHWLPLEAPGPVAARLREFLR